MKQMIVLMLITMSLTACMNNPPRNVSDPTNGQGGFIDADGGSDGNSGGSE